MLVSSNIISTLLAFCHMLYLVDCDSMYNNLGIVLDWCEVNIIFKHLHMKTPTQVFSYEGLAGVLAKMRRLKVRQDHNMLSV